VEIPDYEPFYLNTSDELRAEIARLGLAIPLEENFISLAQPITVGDRLIANRFCAQPITGCDGSPEGAPGELTRRRYQRLAAGGFGAIWVESTIAGRGGDAKRLHLHEGTLGVFCELVEAVRAASPQSPVMILQIASALPADPGALTDGEIECLRDDLVHAAALAARVGFDGIDIQACHGSFAGNLLRAFGRSGRYGGAFENRSRFLLETLAAIRSETPSLLLGVRLCAYDAARNGFGVSATDYRKPDLAEPIRLAQLLHNAGVALLNVTAASPNLRASGQERALQPRTDSERPDEHPLMVLDRQMRIARALREAAPGLVMIGSGFSWLRQFVPHVAAAAIADGGMDFAGLGRAALAYPDSPADMLAPGKMEPGKCCMVCFACSTLRAGGEAVGCVIRDAASYGAVYRHTRRFDEDQLLAGARRCHQCEAAPCVTASPTRTGIPGFIAAFLRGDERAAYEIIRASDPLPELTSHLSPAWLEAEGACIETALTGTPIPIRDLQYTVSWRARERGETGARIPERASGRRIAIIGGGPAGITAAMRLVERGHTVVLFESSDRLGGTPERVIPAGRLPEIRGEIDAALKPAITARRLEVRFGAALGVAGRQPSRLSRHAGVPPEDAQVGSPRAVTSETPVFRSLTLEQLRADYDAMLLAAGVWQESSLGSIPGVLSALDFLEEAKQNAAIPIPDRVAILAGGDSAMDAARTVQQLGAKEIFIVFGGPRSAMHWHMPESWFTTPGVHAMMNWQPLGFVSDADGRACGVRIRNAQHGIESVLSAGLIIEAMGLRVADSLRAALAGVDFSSDGRVSIDAAHRTNIGRVYAAGALVNGGASVGQCVAEGLAAAEAIHLDLQNSI
jgi:NADPH-dependent glutamate synthase beta subunit-like oxidoreductase/2,4-dienoyl-CoA reductase-like NADH-dependent reductase (Old Yellow Enzyme family)